jgi:cob(I)alamin adenosyltransferase
MSWPFGRWYALDGQRRYGSYPAFIALGRLQQRLFDVATDLAQRRQRGERITVEMLGDLHDANDALTAQLKALRDEVTVHRTGSQDTRSIAP